MNIYIGLIVAFVFIYSNSFSQKLGIDEVKYIGKEKSNNGFGRHFNLSVIILKADSTYIIKNYYSSKTRNVDTNKIEPSVKSGYWKIEGEIVSLHSSKNKNKTNLVDSYKKRINSLAYINKYKVKRKDKVKKEKESTNIKKTRTFDKIYGSKPIRKFVKLRT